MTDPDIPADEAEASGPLRAAGDLARAGLETARTKAGDMIAVAREKSEAVIEDTRDKSYRAAAETNRLFQEHPVAAVAAAAAAGAIFAIFMPRIPLASRATGFVRQALKAAVASEAAQIVMSSVEQMGRPALESTPAESTPAVPAVETDATADDAPPAA